MQKCNLKNILIKSTFGREEGIASMFYRETKILYNNQTGTLFVLEFCLVEHSYYLLFSSNTEAPTKDAEALSTK